ncbi:hypothetical protein BGZ60DRAFT_170936 [Tricladium varicosporioides]|nr:hypothetical protein BGZ60DRAFT_170936 [Hymenoscyphus varicosporioides]
MKQRIWPSHQREEDQNQEDSQGSNSPPNSELAEKRAGYTSPSDISTTKAVVEQPSRKSAKRKQPERDIYDVPESPDESEETNTGPSRKRHKGPKSKLPLIAGKKANGQSLPMPTRSEPHDISTPSTQPLKAAQDTTALKRALNLTENTIKDKGQANTRSLRPRPIDRATKPDKRTPHITANFVEAAANSDLTAEESPGHGSSLRKPSSGPRKNKTFHTPQLAENLHEDKLGDGLASPEEALGGDQENEEGVTDILMNPSPIKVATQSIQRRLKKQATSNAPLQLSDVELQDSSEDEFEGQQLEKDPREHGQVEDVTTPSKASNLVDLTMLDRQIQKARVVGHRQNKNGKLVLIRKYETLSSIPGRKLAWRLKSLTLGWKELRGSLGAKDEGGIDAACENITSSAIALQTLSTDIIALTLNKSDQGNDAGDMREFLQDFYFLIVPMFLKCIKSAVKASEGSEMKDWDLIELSRTVEVFCNLATAARKQPIELKPSHSRSYQTSKPTQSVLPNLKTLLQSLHSELDARKRRVRQARYSMKQKQQEKLREELEQRKEHEKRRLINRIHLAQRQALERQYAEPVWGRIIQRNVEEMEEKAELEREERHRSGSARGAGLMRRSRSHSQESDPFEEDAWERVSVFGTNNHNGPRPWTGKQKLHFIDLMRVLKGPVPPSYSWSYPSLISSRTRSLRKSGE